MEDDGTGMPEVPASHAGLGLRIMSYRATMVGGSLDVRRRSPGDHDLLPVSARELKGVAIMSSRAPAHPPGTKRRVLVVDDHPIVRQGLALMIDQEPDLEVCGEAEEAESALAAIAATPARRRRCSTSRCPGRDGIELLKAIRATDPSLPVLVLSMHDESVYAERAPQGRAPTATS